MDGATTPTAGAGAGALRTPNKPAGPMADAVTRHFSLHDDLDGIMSLLEEKLVTVLSPQAPTVPVDNPVRDSVGGSDLVMAVENSSNKLASYRNRVQNLLDRLEI